MRRQSNRTARGSERVITAANLPACYRKRFCTYTSSLKHFFRNDVGPSFLSLILLFAGCSSPKTEPTTNDAPRSTIADVRSSADVVKISASNVSIPAGGSAESTVTLSISPGYHVNANPATFPYLIATEVSHTTDPDDPFFTGKPGYPPSVKKKFQFADEPLAVYEGNVSVTLPLRLAEAGKSYVSLTKGAKVSVPVDVRIQACDQEKCFPPDTLHTTIAVEVK